MNPVQYQVKDGVATITLADEENKNALGQSLTAGLFESLTSANEDPDVRVITLTHSGTVFCAGANLKERSSGTGAPDMGSIGFDKALSLIQTGPKPVVARITGAAMGGGVGLAAAADISIATENAKFGFTEVRLGVAPAVISVVCLPKMRRGEAMEAFLRGNRFTGKEAAELGIISRAVPEEDIDAAVQEVINDLLCGGPMALAAAKKLVNEIPRMTQEDAFPWAADFSAELFASDEAAEGMEAFLQRRNASWVPED